MTSGRGPLGLTDQGLILRVHLLLRGTLNKESNSSPEPDKDGDDDADDEKEGGGEDPHWAVIDLVDGSEGGGGAEPWHDQVVAAHQGLAG